MSGVTWYKPWEDEIEVDGYKKDNEGNDNSSVNEAHQMDSASLNRVYLGPLGDRLVKAITTMMTTAAISIAAIRTVVYGNDDGVPELLELVGGVVVVVLPVLDETGCNVARAVWFIMFPLYMMLPEGQFIQCWVFPAQS